MHTWLQKGVWIPLSLFPPELPPVPSSYRAGRCVSWTGFALFQVPWESGTAVSQRKGASSFRAPGLCHGGQRAGSSPLLWGLQKPSPKSQNANPQSHGAQPSALHPQTAELSLHYLHSQPWKEQGKLMASGICFLHPRGCKHPAQQEMERVVQLPNLAEEDTETDVQGHICPVPQLDSALDSAPRGSSPPSSALRDEFWYSRARAAALSSQQPWLGGASQGHGLGSALAKHISLPQPGSKGSVSLLCQHLEEKGGK